VRKRARHEGIGIGGTDRGLHDREQIVSKLFGVGCSRQ
jgi:hypothetical protein